MDEEKTEKQEEKPLPPRYLWYDHLNVTVKQMDKFIKLCVIALILVFFIIGLDAVGVF